MSRLPQTDVRRAFVWNAPASEMLFCQQIELSPPHSGLEWFAELGRSLFGAVFGPSESLISVPRFPLLAPGKVDRLWLPAP